MDNIKQRRLKVGMSQAELARRSGCSAGHISAVEHGKYNPSQELCAKIENAIKNYRPPKTKIKPKQEARMKEFLNVPFENEQEEAELKRIWRERHGD